MPIDIFNASSVVSDADLERYTAALQVQVTRDFYPVWGRNAKLNFIPKGRKPSAANWQIGIFDNSDQAGALGYHDLTATGLPLGKVFARSDLDNNCSVSVTISHELLEMLGDPWVNLSALDETSSRLYAYENCDAVEDDQFGYRIDSVLVSDFVFPSFFESFWATQSAKPVSAEQYDFGKHVKAPFEVLSGGYLGYLDLANPTQGWQQITAREGVLSGRKPVGSRSERRKTAKHLWVTSVPADEALTRADADATNALRILAHAVLHSGEALPSEVEQFLRSKISD